MISIAEIVFALADSTGFGQKLFALRTAHRLDLLVTGFGWGLLRPQAIAHNHHDKHDGGENDEISEHSLSMSIVEETLIYSEFLRHMDVPPFSTAYQLLKMKKKVKSHFTFFVL